jgi:adenylosuccinate synthase
LPAAETAIFEGSQGVLLDESFGFHPYTTWSTVTTRHAIEILSAAGVESYQTLGLTRAYSTRHGVGPFPTRCKRMTADLNDPGNPRNDWQGVIQAGPLDLVLLRYACEVNSVDGLVVNNVDELPASPQLCRRYLGFDRLAIPLTILDQQRLTQQLFAAQPEMMRTTRSDLLGELSGIAPIEILADGPSYPDRTFVKL